MVLQIPARQKKSHRHTRNLLSCRSVCAGWCQDLSNSGLWGGGHWLCCNSSMFKPILKFLEPRETIGNWHALASLHFIFASMPIPIPRSVPSKLGWRFWSGSKELHDTIFLANLNHMCTHTKVSSQRARGHSMWFTGVTAIDHNPEVARYGPWAGHQKTTPHMPSCLDGISAPWNPWSWWDFFCQLQSEPFVWWYMVILKLQIDTKAFIAGHSHSTMRRQVASHMDSLRGIPAPQGLIEVGLEGDNRTNYTDTVE